MIKTGNRIEKVNDTDLNDFLTYLVDIKGYSQKTALGYGEDVAGFLLFIKESKTDKKDVDRELIRTFLLDLNIKGMSKSSVKRCVSALRHFYTYLYKYKGYETNPFELVSSPKSEKKLPSFFTEKEMCDFLDTNAKRTDKNAKRDQAVLELMYATGLRCSETVNLKISDMDFEQKLIRVTGKGEKERIVPFSETSKKAVREYMDGYRQVCIKDNTCDILFINSKGEPLTERGLEYLVKSAAEKCGLTVNVHPHMIRHSYATTLLSNGVDIRIIQELLGHSSIGTTSIYTHVTFEDLRKTYDECFAEVDREQDEK